jgi:NTE family protein
VGDFGRLVRSVYLGAAFQSGKVWADTSAAEFSDLRPLGTVFAGFDNAFSPVFLGYRRADGGQDEFYLFIGELF